MKTFETNKELVNAVILWFENLEECIKKYGHISFWDVSKITDMSRLFWDEENFNENLIDLKNDYELLESTKIINDFINLSNRSGANKIGVNIIVDTR